MTRYIIGGGNYVCFYINIEYGFNEIPTNDQRGQNIWGTYFQKGTYP